jgi:shikimate kinase
MGFRAVFLVGFMASGKSSVGQELARRLGWDFVDLDSRIESREQKTIPEIFQDRGEPGFRRAETAALRDVTETLERDTVVALGGGAFAEPETRALLHPWPSVFLEAPLEELWRRCIEDATPRPLRKDRVGFASLYEDRLPFYRQATVTVVTSGKDPASLCAEIERRLQLEGAKGKSRSSQSPAHPSADFETGESQ